jgi:hypothetical protein
MISRVSNNQTRAIAVTLGIYLAGMAIVLFLAIIFTALEVPLSTSGPIVVGLIALISALTLYRGNKISKHL